jgi:hypothetical protein
LAAWDWFGGNFSLVQTRMKKKKKQNRRKRAGGSGSEVNLLYSEVAPFRCFSFLFGMRKFCAVNELYF